MNNDQLYFYNRGFNDCLAKGLNPVNTCKHGVDDGACKECYLEATHPAELTDEEIFSIAIDCTYGGDLHADKFARAILRKAQEK